MQAAEIIERITSAGGRIWLEQDKVRAHIPETLRPLVSVISSHKPELMAELARRPLMPAGVRLIRWERLGVAIRPRPMCARSNVDGEFSSAVGNSARQ